MVNIRRNNLYNFQGHSTGSTGWFNLDREWLKEKVSTLEPDSYKKPLEMNIDGKEIETFFKN